MSLGDLTSGSPSPDAERNRKLGVLAAVTLVVLVLIGIASLSGDDDDDGDVVADDATTTTEEADEDETENDADGFAYGDGECPPPEKPDEPVRQFADAPQRCITDGVDYAAVVDTNLGAFTIDLFEDRAPGTVNNFVVLARYGYYDSSSFHRIIPGFVVQGGDPVGSPPGTGDPGYTIADELPEDGAYEIGSVAMANAGPDTNGSQFFIVVGPNGVSLPPDYSLFGEVTEGLDVVQAIEQRGSAGGEPTEPVLITTVEILER